MESKRNGLGFGRSRRVPVFSSESTADPVVLMKIFRTGSRTGGINQSHCSFPRFVTSLVFPHVLCHDLWVTFLAETSKDLEIILITIVRSFTNSLSRTSLYFSLMS